MSDGGKGSTSRPISVSNEEYANRWDAIFGKDKLVEQPPPVAEEITPVKPSQSGFYFYYTKMKTKNNLTIVCLDTMFHKLAARAIDKAVQVTGCSNVLVLSDQDFYPGSTWIKIKPIDFPTYSKVMFKDMHKYVKTTHYMVVQYDGMPTDSTYWDPEYLNYDYIGAVWPWHPEGSNVGNGGVSLRSRKLAKIFSDPTLSHSPFGK